MEVRIRETGQVVNEQEFRRLYPNTSFPEVLTPDILETFQVDPILEGPQATTTPPYEISFRDGVEEINGKWFTKYSIGPNFESEEDEAAYKTRIDDEAAKGIRTQRDRLLQETDWIVIKAKETGTNLSAALKTYRQELRDITTQEGFPHTITWPEKP
jgi:hypothetical protein